MLMKKVLIIGAGFLQDFVICKAKEMGYETFAVDADAKAPGFLHADHSSVIDITDEKACLDYARKNEIDGVLTAATDYGVLTASYIAREMGLPGLRYDVAQLIKNKYQVRKCLIEHHVDQTKQVVEVNEDTDFSMLACQLSFPVMVKPCDGSGSRGISRIDDDSQLREKSRLAMKCSASNRAVIETFFAGKEYGAEALVIDGEPHVLAVMKKWMTDPPVYAELGHAVPNDLSEETEQSVIRCIREAILSLGINSGSVNTDLIISEDGKVNIIDIGARMGGNMIGPCIIPYGTGIDYMAAMIRVALGEPADFSISRKKAVGTRLLAFDEGEIKRLPDFKQIEDDFGVEIYHHMKNGDKVNTYRSNIDGCGYIVAKADNVGEAVDTAEKVLQLIKEHIFD